MFFLQVTIQRRLLSIVLTTFLPTLIVNIVGHMSNYFKEFFFEGLISTNVTVLLVITTLFIRLVLRVPIFIGASIEIKWTLPVIVEVVKLVFAEKDLLLFFFQHQQKHLYCDYLCNFTHFDDPAFIYDGPDYNQQWF